MLQFQAGIFCGICVFLFTIGHICGEVCRTKICTFSFDIRHVRSMTYRADDGDLYDVVWNKTQLEVVSNSYRQSAKDTEEKDVIGTRPDADDVITLDGYARDIIVINDQFPGPIIEVMEGSQVVVHVTNHLLVEGLTIHWHGLFLHDTPWMDGVAHITQCPIQPSHSFTYRFLAEPAGGHWYHAHNTAQRMDGLFGQLLIHSALPLMNYFPVTIIDWWHPEARSMEISDPNGISYKGTGQNHISSKNTSFAEASLTYYSTLVGGRGRSDPSEKIPLETYRVASGKNYLFNMVHAGADYMYEVSVDSHQLQIVACDGGDISPLTVNAFILSPGERVDFTLLADQPVNRYWLRVRTLGSSIGLNPSDDGVIQEGLGIIQYTGTLEDDKDPTSSYLICTENNPCSVFKCPFKDYQENSHRHCVSMDDANSVLDYQEMEDKYGLNSNHVDEHFINFNFAVGANINGWRFESPSVPMYQNGSEDYIFRCEDVDYYKCTQIETIPANKTIQMVLTNLMGGNSLVHHVAHLHGHNFAVVGMGYPEFDTSTGAWTKQNNDILCDDGPRCTQVRWNGKIPKLNLNNPPVKDTVVVPARGYTVIRFNADNPGYWILHCHQELHFTAGMGILIQEGDPRKFSRLPRGFPVCGDFDWSSEQLESSIYQESLIPDESSEGVTLAVNQVVVIAVVVFLFGLVLGVVLHKCKKKLTSLSSAGDGKKYNSL